MDPKVKPPTRIVVSGGPKVEPHLFQAHQERPFSWPKTIAMAVIGVVIIWAFVALFLLLGAGA